MGHKFNTFKLFDVYTVYKNKTIANKTWFMKIAL